MMLAIHFTCKLFTTRPIVKKIILSMPTDSEILTVDINHIQMLCPTTGSMKEREVYKKAGRQVGQKNESPGELELFIKHAPAIHGTDFDVIIEVYNAGREDTDAQLTVMSNAITYNSIHRGECQRKTTSLTVPAHKGKKTSKLSTLNYVAHGGICKQISPLI